MTEGLNSDREPRVEARESPVAPTDFPGGLTVAAAIALS